MRLHAIRPLLVFALGLAGAGCGGTPPSATSPAPGKDAVGERPIGTTGLPGLDWGADIGAIKAAYPNASALTVGLLSSGDVEGRPAQIYFGLDADYRLAQVDIRWDLAFDSMESCGEALHQVRPAIDARLGEGSEENLAVFWENATVSVRLSCDPDDAEQPRLTQTYQRTVAE